MKNIERGEDAGQGHGDEGDEGGDINGGGTSRVLERVFTRMCSLTRMGSLTKM
jgi:hypothetical protein